MRSVLLHGCLLTLFAHALAAAPCVAPPLAPVVRALPPVIGDGVRGVAWLDAKSILVATNNGVVQYPLDESRARTVIGPERFADRVARVENVTTDGVRAFTFRPDAVVQGVELRSGRASLTPQLNGIWVFDLAVHGDELYVLGMRGQLGAADKSVVAVWKAKIGSPQTGLTPLHVVQTRDAAEIFAHAAPRYGGALTVDAKGTVWLATPAEPGLWAYEPSGVKHRYAASVTELRVRDMWKIPKLYNVDEAGRYTNVLNRQPTIEDLVTTPQGPALIVRKSSHNQTSWELWQIDRSGVRTRTDMGLRRAGPLGHLRCAAAGSRLACVFGEPSGRGETGRLALYALSAKPPACR